MHLIEKWVVRAGGRANVVVVHTWIEQKYQLNTFS